MNYPQQNQMININNNNNNRIMEKSQMPKNSRLVASLPHGDVVCAVVTSDPFRYIYTGGKGCIKIWDTLKLKEKNMPIEPIASIDCLDGYIRACKVTPDSRSLIVAGESKYIVICDITKPQPIIQTRLESPPSAEATYSLSTSMDSRYLFSCSSDGCIYVWDIHTSKLIKTLRGHNDSVTCCSMTPDGKLVTGSLDKTVRIWDVGPEKEMTKIDFESQIFSLGVSPKVPWISVGLESSIVDVHCIYPTGNNDCKLRGHSKCVLSLKYAPSGDWFVTTGKDHQWIIWKGPYGGLILSVSKSFNIANINNINYII